MDTNQVILITFFAIFGLILLSGYLLKAFRKGAVGGQSHERKVAGKVDFDLKGDIFELNRLALILEDLERYGVPVRTIFELNVIIEEVFASILNHQSADAADHTVKIGLLVESDHVTATIRDRNEEFDPTRIPKIDLTAPIEEISFQGLGFHLVRHLADQVGYRRVNGQNVLTIKKNWVPE